MKPLTVNIDNLADMLYRNVSRVRYVLVETDSVEADELIPLPLEDADGRHQEVLSVSKMSAFMWAGRYKASVLDLATMIVTVPE